MRAAQELLGAPTIGGAGSAWPGGGGGGSQRSQIHKLSKPPRINKNSTKTAGLLHLMTFKKPKRRFLFKSI
jgi:hypothetical protein